MINEFRGKYRWLSNFSKANIVFENAVYFTTEAAYQAAKTTDSNIRIQFQNPDLTPRKAREIGQTISLREGWDKIKFQIMYDINKQKFEDPEYKKLLLETGDQELVEGNTYGDQYWGVCNGVGENNLGKILMKIREELKNE